MKLVGTESRIQVIEQQFRSDKVNILGIWGMGGIGKTALASAFFSSNFGQFDSSFFAPNIRQLDERGSLTHLRQDLDTNLNTSATPKKVLIVLDDVTNEEQIDFLIGSHDSFMPGSVIIITTRNKQVLKNRRVENIYTVGELENDHARSLFIQHAFDQNPDGFNDLVEKTLEYAQGVPLAIKVLGCLLYGRSREVWESEVRELEECLPKDIQKVLKISYDDLNGNQQNMFLHVACIHEDKHRDFVIGFLNDNDFAAEIGISVLDDRCLIVVADDKIKTHSLLKKMGRAIASPEFINDVSKRINDLGKCNRIELGKIFAIANFVLEIPSAVFDQLSSARTPRYAIVSMSLSFVAMLLCIIELVYRCGEEKVTGQWRSILPWLYYPPKTRSKPFGNNLKDIIQLIGLACAICQCVFAIINFYVLRHHAENPVKISFWPIIFAFGLLCSTFSEKPVRRCSRPSSR